MKNSRWSIYDAQIKSLVDSGETLPSTIARGILGQDADSDEVQLMRTYISRHFLGKAQSRRKEKEVDNHFDNETITETNQYEYMPVLSARKSNGGIMSAKEFCEHYGLPYEETKSYKLLTHTKYPTYNIASHVVNDGGVEAITPEFIEELVKRHNKKFKYQKRLVFDGSNFIDRLVFTDTHIGMEASSATSQYQGGWGADVIMDRMEYMMRILSKYSRSNELYIIDLGDFMDGYDGFTARRDHKLPQCMDTQEAFDLGVEFKLAMLDAAVQLYSKVVLDNVCNDNHGGSFAYLVNSAVEKIALHRYNGEVEVRNHRKFISHYVVGDRAFVFSHGKDEKFMKSGMKANPDSSIIQKIDGYCKQQGLYKYKHITFEKGDSHQCILDFTTSDDFPYLSYPSFAPQSEWVQTNFKVGQSGFVIQNLDMSDGIISFTPVFF